MNAARKRRELSPHSSYHRNNFVFGSAEEEAIPADDKEASLIPLPKTLSSVVRSNCPSGPLGFVPSDLVVRWKCPPLWRARGTARTTFDPGDADHFAAAASPVLRGLPAGQRD